MGSILGVRRLQLGNQDKFKDLQPTFNHVGVSRYNEGAEGVHGQFIFGVFHLDEMTEVSGAHIQCPCGYSPKLRSHLHLKTV